MKTINHENLTSLQLTDVLETVITQVEALANCVEDNGVASLLGAIVDSTYYILEQEGGLSHE